MKERNKILGTVDLLNQTSLRIQNKKVGTIVCDWISCLQGSMRSVNFYTWTQDKELGTHVGTIAKSEPIIASNLQRTAS